MNDKLWEEFELEFKGRYDFKPHPVYGNEYESKSAQSAYEAYRAGRESQSSEPQKPVAFRLETMDYDASGNAIVDYHYETHNGFSNDSFQPLYDRPQNSEALALLQKLEAMGFLTETEDSSDTHREACREYRRICHD